MSIYIHESVSPDKIAEFLKNQLNERKTEIQSFQMYKGDTLLAKVAIPPYESDNQGQLYSLSKSFASTAIGIACDMGLLTVDDKIIDIFPDKAPTNPSENLSAMTVHHVLSMNTGHKECVMPSIAQSDDGVKAFFENEVEFYPGTHFAYNTGATYMLSAIITKLTGKTLLDFLLEKLFLPLGIIPSKWQTSGGNINEGGIGLFLSCDDIVKLGLLYLNNGMYNDTRILSEKWVAEAQKPHSDNSGNGTHDWTSGYGYQFWMCAKGGYRGDGAFGQYIVIVPDKDIVFAAKTETSDMQGSLDGIFELIDNYEKDGNESDEMLLKTVNEMYMPMSSENPAIPVKDIYYLKENLSGFTAAMPVFGKDGFSLCFSDGNEVQFITAGNGKWELNRINAKSFKPVLTGLAPYLRNDVCEFYASYSTEGSKVVIDMRYTNCPHHTQMTVEFSGDDIEIRHIVRDGTIYEEGLVIKN